MISCWVHKSRFLHSQATEHYQCWFICAWLLKKNILYSYNLFYFSLVFSNFSNSNFVTQVTQKLIFFQIAKVTSLVLIFFFLLIFQFYFILFYFPKNVLILVYSNTVEYNEALSLRYLRLLFMECLVPVVPEKDD